MDFRYDFVYIFTLLYCIANTFIILFRLNYNVGSAMEIRLFRRMCASYIGFLLFEMVWILGISGTVPMPLHAASMAKILSTMLIPLMIYFWFIFAATRFRAKWVDKTLPKYIAFIPIIVMTALYIYSIKSGLVFSLTPEGGIKEGPLAALTGIVDNIYGISIIIYAAVLWFREKSHFQRSEYVRQIVFIIICTLGGLLDAAMTMTPIMPLMITLSFNFLFINHLEGQIYNDALTGLNNRRRADRYIEESIAASSPENPCYLMMIDADNFKNINDSYGHIEGDRALVFIADAMRKIAGKYRGLLARYGGDEFVILTRDARSFDFDAFVSDTDAAIKSVIQEHGLPYEVSVSIGCARCGSPKTNMNDLIAEADKMMYANKANRT